MPATQLRCRELSAGDILLKVSDGSILSRAIQTGQSLVGGKNPGVVHAGVMFDSTFIVEAQGPGVSANDLRVQNKSYGYYVYQFVAEQCGLPAANLFKTSDAKMHPSALAASLSRHSLFAEAGWLFPNER